MRPDNDNNPHPKQEWEIIRDITNALYEACGIDWRLPTNPQTYSDKGESL